jgi:CRISPR-associated protein Csb3
MAFYGLASILEAEPSINLRLAWTGGMTPQPCLSGVGLSEEKIGEVVTKHAQALSNKGAWPSKRVELFVMRKGEPAIADLGLMSPRIATIFDWMNRDSFQKNVIAISKLMIPRIATIFDWRNWSSLQRKRWSVLNDLTEKRSWVDLRLLWSLGEPCYWRLNSKGEETQDYGSSRLEMQPRNRGAEIVTSRFKPLTKHVGERPPEDVVKALRGEIVNDERGENKPDSRSATGFRGLGPVDDVVAWCALWGISQFPLSLSTRKVATTAGHLGSPSGDNFYVPVWQGAWTPSRLRTIIASRQLREFAKHAVDEQAQEAIFVASERWLVARGIQAVITFPIKIYGSANAPERRAQQGIIHKLGEN